VQIANNIRPCAVSTKNTIYYGLLFIDSPDNLVLANHVAEKALMGPIEQRRVRFIDAEANFVILPRDEVQKVQFFRVCKDNMSRR